MTDPIADMLTRIRNAQVVKKPEAILPYSKLKFNLLNLLVQEGWIGKVEHIEAANNKANFKKSRHDNIDNRFDTLKVKLEYQDNRQPKIESLKRISKPGRRVYVNKDQIPLVKNGRGLSIISTSQGLLTDKQAREKKVGGEVICEIY